MLKSVVYYLSLSAARDRAPRSILGVTGCPFSADGQQI